MGKAPGYSLPVLNSSDPTSFIAVEGGRAQQRPTMGTSANSPGECRQPGSQEGQDGRERSDVLKMEAHVRHSSAT